jgi:hypothetical protein
MEDWEKLNNFLKDVRKTYTDLERRYAHQYGLTSEDVSTIRSECYTQVGSGPNRSYEQIGIDRDSFLACVKEKSLNLQATKGLPLNQ